MKDIFVIVVMSLAFLFGASYFGFKSYEFFAPRYQSVDRKVFEETKGYNDGMIRDLENLKMQYLSGNQDQKMALKATILHRFSVYQEDRLPIELQTFYKTLREEPLK